MKKLLNIGNDCENIRLEVHENIVIITMNRPKALNALNNQTLEELEWIITALETAQDVRGVILTGEGKAFVAGADIVQMQDYGREEGRDYANFAQSVFSRLECLEKPVLAAVNGFALGGGCELALSCDFIYASEKAKFGQPEVNLGVIPCFGGTQRLTRAIGARMAKELIYTGRHISADEAMACGLVNKVVPAEKLMEEALSTMKLIATKAPMAVRYSKVAINHGSEMNLQNGLELEKDLAGITFGTEDKMTGMKAFLNKETPVFSNK